MIAKANNHSSSSASSPARHASPGPTKGARTRQGKGAAGSAKTAGSSGKGQNTRKSGDEIEHPRLESQGSTTLADPEQTQQQQQQQGSSTPAKTTAASKRRQRQQTGTSSEHAAAEDVLAPADLSAVTDNFDSADQYAEVIDESDPFVPVRTRGKRTRTKKGGKTNDGQSQAELAHEPAAPDGTAPVSQLSKSAPTSSFMQQANVAARRQHNASHPIAPHHADAGNNSMSTSSNIRGSNSADEWDMPAVARGTDALTWQQQSLGRKSSLRSASTKQQQQQSNQFTKKAVNIRSTAPHGPSGIGAAFAASSHEPSEPAHTPPSSIVLPKALTWQQELFQRSAPATPSDVFASLEEGFSGAHPARESAYNKRVGQSPSKAEKTRNNVQQYSEDAAHASSEGEAGLSKAMHGLGLDKGDSAPNKQTRRAKSSAGSDAKTSGLGALPQKTRQHPSGSSHQRVATSDESDDAPFEELNPQAQLARLFARASPMPAPSPPSGFVSAKSASAVPIEGSPAPAPAPARPVALSVSPSKSALYAGPKFHNSPSAGQLPTPRLAGLLNKSRDATPSVGA